MKRIVLFILVAGWMTLSGFSQVTIGQSDMPVAGDTLRVSVTNVVPAGYTSAATDTAWDFSALQELTQRVDTFVSATATPPGYQLFFVLLGGANLASPRSSAPVPGLPVSQGFTFFKNSAESFSDLGSAYTIQGIPLPAKYDIPDKQYQFPMTPGMSWSSNSSFAVAVPGMASYITRRNRSNLVDGWGTLTTPYGTFQTLRVKSNLAIYDSIYIDSLGTGFPMYRNIIEYKWLAKGKGIPLLQINEEGNLVTAIYRDVYRMSAQPLKVTLGPDTAVYKGTVLTLHAIITGGTPPYQVLWNTLDTGNTITVTVLDVQTYSVVVVDALQNLGAAQKVVSIRHPAGIEENASSQLLVSPNPANGLVHITLPGKYANALLQVLTAQGKIVRALHPDDGAREVDADLSDLPAGLYLISMIKENRIYTARIQIIR